MLEAVGKLSEHEICIRVYSCVESPSELFLKLGLLSLTYDFSKFSKQNFTQTVNAGIWRSLMTEIDEKNIKS